MLERTSGGEKADGRLSQTESLQGDQHGKLLCGPTASLAPRGPAREAITAPTAQLHIYGNRKRVFVGWGVCV